MGEIDEKVCGDTECVHPHCWGIRGYEVGRMIFAKKVKERLQLHKECEYSDNKDEDEGFKSGIGWAIKEIDNTLKEKGED